MNRYDRSWKDFTAEDFEDDPLLTTLQRLIEGALFISILLLIVVIMQNRDLADQVEGQKATAEHHKTEAAKYSGLLAECMNGGGMYDRASGTAYFCEKALEMRI